MESSFKFCKVPNLVKDLWNIAVSTCFHIVIYSFDNSVLWLRAYVEN